MTAAEFLNLHKLRKTPARLSIIRNLMASSRPLSESDFREKMQETYERITFYRSMQTLMEAGVIHRIVADHMNVCYALNSCTMKQHEHLSDHIHFHCIKCGMIECLKGVTIQHYTLPDGYQNKECNVMVKGICKQCTEKI
jgi:Fur family ferric uptake transcriptional regulator